jgi:hypothetical protein
VPASVNDSPQSRGFLRYQSDVMFINGTISPEFRAGPGKYQLYPLRLQQLVLDQRATSAGSGKEEIHNGIDLCAPVVTEIVSKAKNKATLLAG